MNYPNWCKMKQTLILFFFALIMLSCKIEKPIVINLPQLNTNELIQDCPEELIIDGMPTTVKNQANQYFIYKGIRREVIEFDTAWINKNCSSMIITRVY